MITPTRLVLVGGLPGTGKSTLAASIARTLHSPLFAKDPIEAALRRSNIPDGGFAAYEVLFSLASSEIESGRPVVLDAVFAFERLRSRAATLAGAAFRAIECVCSDEAVHRSRLDGRVRGIPGWYELEWSEVERVRASWEPWTGERLVLDAVEPLAGNVARALSYAC